jgi:multiple sugar transport system substrate-binding protein
MNHPSHPERGRRRRSPAASRIAALLAAVALLTAACGTNENRDGGNAGAASSGTGAGTASGSPAGSGADTGSAGASGEGEASGSAAAGPELSGELTVWGMGNEGAKMEVLADAFMEQNPNVTVSVTPIDWGQAVTRLQTAIAGGETPDVSQMGTDMMGQFVETGALEPVPGDIDPGQFFESAWNTGVVEGAAYSVPWYVETRLLYYRTDIAEKAGITEAPATWDDLKAMAQAMQEQGGAEYGISLGTKNWQEFLPFLWSNGGDVMNESGEFTLNTPEAVEALTFYDSFFEDGLSPNQVPEGFDITPAFVAGTHPMFFSGPWHLGLIEEAGGADIEGKWAIAPMPQKESATSFVGGSNLVVFNESDNKDAAWAFVNFLSQPDTQVTWYEEATVLPSVQEGWEDPALADDENLAVFGEQLQDTKAQPAISTWSEVGEALNASLERLTTGDADPQAIADEMQQAASGIGTGG